MTENALGLREITQLAARVRARECGLPEDKLSDGFFKELLERPAPDFTAAMRRVLAKNSKLYTYLT